MKGQNHSKKVRAFIALHLPEAAKAELELVADVLAGQMPPRSVRWVKPHLMHLTLRFLGDTAVSDLPALYAALDEIAAAHQPITLHQANLGCFPNRSRPRVIWAGLDGEVTAVQALQAAIEQAVCNLGFPPEDKPFNPHLTLGRVKDGRLLRGVEWGTTVKKISVPVTAVHLMQSDLRPGGPIYTVRHTSQLTMSNEQ
ncbi:MAG: RNA 2',3'-cyclic phosphodiesterase [Anaerolineales bacterium]|nr:RNA 2',3'-cyclic phosphodiesterase [Anaerolineales bacterium]